MKLKLRRRQMAGRPGTRRISRILGEAYMPYLPTHAIDIVLNPLGVSVAH